MLRLLTCPERPLPAPRFLVSSTVIVDLVHFELYSPAEKMTGDAYPFMVAGKEIFLDSG
jgi:hypothetical protein